MILLKNFPLLLLPLLAYNAYNPGMFALPAPLGEQGQIWSQAIASFSMLSGTTFIFTRGELVVILALFLLFIEILKATRTARATIIDHLFSTLVFVAYLVQFLVDPAAATFTFFACMLIAFLDVVAGYSISIRVAARDVTFGG